PGSLDDYEIVKRYIKSIGKGLLKVMSKMGISTYQSYCGAQIFDAVGLKADFVAKYFPAPIRGSKALALPRLPRRPHAAMPMRSVTRR
ncbi:glutamate synthase central domain-containing protein, partial [Acinetobacter baumannii]